MKKRAIAIVLAVAALTGVAGSRAVAADTAATAQPCCKSGS